MLINKNKLAKNNYYYVCGYKINNYDRDVFKPSKKVAPTQVIYLHIDDVEKMGLKIKLPFYKSLSDDKWHLLKVNKNGNVSTKVINTDDLFIFDNEKECINEYKILINRAIKLIEKKKISIINSYDVLLNDLKKLI